MSVRMLLPWVLLAAAVTGAPTAAGPAPAVEPDRDPAEVRKVIAAQADAWNRGDLEGYMRGYWESDSLTFYGGGDVTRGWKPTLERYRKRCQGEGREMGRLTLDLADVSIVAPGQAVVRGAWALVRAADRPHGLFTLWLRHFGRDGWRVVHDHSSSAS
ncbi:MAG: DUF4440 domain-containing protein [Candidatus Eisenbacteria bacterium]|nr:DUF4440 domain-containing protein [Candidatus Eisenbacteria bacterium]